MSRHRKRAWRVAVTAMGAAVLFGVACSTFSGTESESDGHDASSASNDAATTDGSATPDVGAIIPFCADSGHWLCDDFDRDSALIGLPYWGSTGVTGDASLDVVQPDTPPPSPPNALSAYAESSAGATVIATYDAPSSGFTCSFAFRIVHRGTAEVNLVLLSLYGSASYYRLNVGGSPDGFTEYGTLSNDAGSLGVTSLSAQAFTDDTWNHVKVTASPEGGAARVSVNNVDLNVASTYALAAFGPTTYTTLQLGVASYGGTGGWTVLYDNVTCDPIP